jgi:UDP-N-acetylmuramate--alanine ligase
MFRGRIKKLHFVGIGGSGMSGIAEVLLNMGYEVSGSDINDTAVTRRLKKLGAVVYKDHVAENVSGTHCVVFSSAVSKDNAELKEARKLQIPIIARAEMLAELMRMKYGIVVAGTHGKTTTTSMIAAIMGAAGLDPTVVTGGKLNAIEANARLGTGEFLVAEADESDGSFLRLTPTIAVVTNIDREHMDHYSDFEEVKSSYMDFVNKTPFFGCTVLCLDDSVIQGLLPAISGRVITYGLSVQADVHASSIVQKAGETSFKLKIRSEGRGEGLEGKCETITIGMPGRHNVQNALAASAVALELEISLKDIKIGLEEFSGVERRFQVKGTAGDIMVVDDYGHHPTEVLAVLRAVKEGWKRRSVAVFQPHRYSRTEDLFSDFFKAFNDADVLIITDIYPAGEKPIKGITSESLFKAIKEHGHRDVHLVADLGDVPEALLGLTQPGDMVITLGAGDVWKAGERFLTALRDRYPDTVGLKVVKNDK